MADFLKILEQKIDFSPSEQGVAERWFRQVERDNLFANAISSSGGGGGVTELQAGNVSIDLAEGVTLRNPGTGDRTIYLDPDGDAWFGSNIGSPSTTALSIFSNAETNNSEIVGAGDVLLGDNSSGKGNLFWDASTGQLKIRSGTTTSVLIGSGGIVVDWATIGGWSIDATRIYNSNMEFNSATSKITAGTIVLDGGAETFSIWSGLVFTGATEKLTIGGTVTIDGTTGTIQSDDFDPGHDGWRIDGDGDAEFNSIVARGSIKTAVFEKGHIVATGGEVIVSKNAGELAVDSGAFPTTLGQIFLYIKNDSEDDPIGAVDDTFWVKGYDDIAGVYCQGFGAVTTVVDQLDGTTRFQVQMGGAGMYLKQLRKGNAVVNIGAVGDGTIELEAGSTTRIKMRELTGQGTGAGDIRAVIGNMNAYYGTGANDRVGFGFGDYSSGNYLSYNAAVADEFVLRTGDGGLTLDDTGMEIEAAGSDAWSSKVGIRWADGVGGASPIRLWGYITGADLAWAKLEAVDKGTGGSGGNHTGIDIFADAGFGKQGQITLRASSDNLDNESSMTLHNDDAGADYIQLATNGYLEILSGNISITEAGDITAVNNIIAEGGLTAGDGTGYSSVGIKGINTNVSDLAWYASGSLAAIFRRDTNDDIVWMRYNPAGTLANAAEITFDSSNGDIFSIPWTYYDPSPTIVGWASLSTKHIFYKKIGKTVHVWFAIQGTSNATNAYFYMPFNVRPASGQSFQVMIYAVNNGAVQNTMGRLDIPSSGNQFNMYLNMNAGGWVASGLKGMRGHFTYEAN